MGGGRDSQLTLLHHILFTSAQTSTTAKGEGTNVAQILSCDRISSVRLTPITSKPSTAATTVRNAIRMRILSARSERKIKSR
jgi:hypothetical protein